MARKYQKEAPPPTAVVGKSSSKDGDESIMSDLTGFTGDPSRGTSPNRPTVQTKSLLTGSPLSDDEHEPEFVFADNGHDDTTMAAFTARQEEDYGIDETQLLPATSFEMPAITEGSERTSRHSIDDIFRHSSSTLPTGNRSPAVKKTGYHAMAVPSQSSLAIDFLQDDPSSMTWSRRLALSLAGRYRWYNPRLNHENAVEQDEDVGASMLLGRNDSMGKLDQMAPSAVEAYPFSHSRRENPSLEKAWAYFEHVALPRYVLEPKQGDKTKSCCTKVVHRFQKAHKQLKRAEPGEKELPTKLYEPIWTPHKQLGDFGLGIGLYFSTLRAITILTLLAGILNTPNFMYFSSAEYSAEQVGVRDLLKGSAICTETVWVPCPTCDPADFDKTGRLAIGTSTSGFVGKLALKNDCDGATMQQGFISYATLFLILFGTFALNRYLKKMAIAFDEDEQTAQDYSVVVDNPPGDATDPEEWRKFFYDNFDRAHLTACTIAVDNDLLVRTLVERRELLRKIEMKVEPGTSLDKLTLAGIAAKEERDRKWWQRLLASLAPGVPELFGKLVVATAKVQGLAQQDYPATNVFLTFETEAAQRRVLAALSAGSFAIMRNNTSVVKDPKHLFRGKYLLSVSEPDEPNTIRWQDLNEKLKDRLKQQALTLFATMCAIALIAFLVRLTNEKNVVFSAFAISIFNSLFPMFAKFLNGFESHSSEGGKQRSLYCKIALFRWVNTAIVITIITPFTKTLTNKGGLVEQIYALFFAEIVTTNIIQLADPVGHLKRHFLAPRASTQDQMNLAFTGAEFELAERYTNVTKILFLALWYCAIYPGAFFMCSFALFINYFTDRFSLMRTWKRQPHLGTAISEVSRQYFFSLALLAMAVISSYFWSGFPYDNLCMTNSTAVAGNDSQWTVQLTEGDFVKDPVVETTVTYEYCLQDFFRYPLNATSFPFVAASQMPGAEWMTASQETVTTVYGWTSVVVLVLVLVSFAWMFVRGFLRFFWSGGYTPSGEDQRINFSDVPSISSYVPQVESVVFSYPLLACNVDKVDKELLDWTDPDRPHSFYDLTKDADVLLRGTDVSAKTVFSQISHWPPDRKGVFQNHREQ